MNEQILLDNQLADTTDLILKGQDYDAPPELQAEAQVVKKLHQIMTRKADVDSAFRARLSQRLNDEWRLREQQKRRTNIVAFSTYRRAMSLAAALVVILGVAILVTLISGDSSGGDVAATASGSSETLIIAGLAILGILSGFAIWGISRRS